MKKFFKSLVDKFLLLLGYAPIQPQSTETDEELDYTIEETSKEEIREEVEKHGDDDLFTVITFNQNSSLLFSKNKVKAIRDIMAKIDGKEIPSTTRDKGEVVYDVVNPEQRQVNELHTGVISTNRGQVRIENFSDSRTGEINAYEKFSLGYEFHPNNIELEQLRQESVKLRKTIAEMKENLEEKPKTDGKAVKLDDIRNKISAQTSIDGENLLTKVPAAIQEAMKK